MNAKATSSPIPNTSARLSPAPWLGSTPTLSSRGTVRQFENGDFRSGAEADWGTGGADAAVDVELAAGFLIPSADVGRLRSGEGEAAAEELERKLATVRGAGQHQVDAELGCAIEGVRVVIQQNVDRSWHHQLLAPLHIPVNKVPVMIAGESRLLIVNADQVQRFAVRLNGYSLLTQDSDLLARKKARNRLFGFGHVLVVAQAAENSVGRTETREDVNYFPLSPGIIGKEIAGQRDQVGFQPVGDRDATANLVPGHEWADVDIGELDDAKSLESLGQARQADALASDLYVEPPVKKPVGRGH